MGKAKNKKNLLVTLADKNYVEPAKQLFSSVYWNAGWRGDYMLLAHEISEKKLEWFRRKGILIKKCEPLYRGKVGGWRPATHTSKFYLFAPEFKKWDNVVYLDGDIIVRGSLDELTEINGFGATLDLWNSKLSEQIINVRLMKERRVDKKIFINLSNELIKYYDLKEDAFNSGVMAFSTDVIKKDTFSKLYNIFKKYEKIGVGGDQLIFNIFFYKNWIKLSPLYNIWPIFMRSIFNIEDEKIKGIILHFVGIWQNDKPWIVNNYFYKEWTNNLQRAELIDFKKIPPPLKKWTKPEIEKYSFYLKSKRVFLKKIYLKTKENVEFTYKLALRHISRFIGIAGLFLKKHFPKLYFKLKK
ncbi:MAG: glycosyltransferase [Patescibacteria group bacterium]|nr:glycosyltransferase [Patescibacteria group bacterium]